MVRCYVPYEAIAWRAAIKALPTSFFHYDQKLWSVVHTSDNMEALKGIFGDQVECKTSTKAPKIPYIQLNEAQKEQIATLEQKLILKSYSRHTVKSYKQAFIPFLGYFKDKDLGALTKAEIEGYIFHLKNKHKISNSHQNVIINAIKFYMEQVLGMQRTYYNLQRPKRSKTLPNILSEKEVKKLLGAPKNLKHRTILYLIYSGGLRLSEAIQLRVQDIHSADHYILIKGGKGKKDRRTVLSPLMLQLLRTYYLKYRPSYWLFEGQTGGQYSASSIQKIFRKAVEKSGINPWATVHTLRHSFATHPYLIWHKKVDKYFI